jgi:hypothetical protein
MLFMVSCPGNVIAPASGTEDCGFKSWQSMMERPPLLLEQLTLYIEVWRGE